ncbi:hypothetical protein Tco_1305268, partial [Tanacetum coccineum]
FVAQVVGYARITYESGTVATTILNLLRRYVHWDYTSPLGFPVVVGKGLEQPTEPQPTSFIAPQEILTQVATATASQPSKDPNIYRRTKRGRNTKVPQSGGSPKKVGDEAINEEMLDSVERAITTDASLDAAQDSDNITKTQSTATLNEPDPQGEDSSSGP